MGDDDPAGAEARASVGASGGSNRKRRKRSKGSRELHYKSTREHSDVDERSSRRSVYGWFSVAGLTVAVLAVLFARCGSGTTSSSTTVATTSLPSPVTALTSPASPPTSTGGSAPTTINS